ncbi:penicillin-binding transpeptidase domain-containing protein [Shigella flexneri]
MGRATSFGVGRKRSGLYPQKQRWSDVQRATFSWLRANGNTVTVAARVYATIGSYGIYRHCRLPKLTPRFPVNVSSRNPLSALLVHMMESVALPGGGGVKAAIKGYRIASKTGTAKKVSRTVAKWIDVLAYTAGVAPLQSAALRAGCCYRRENPQAGKYYGGAVSAPVFGAIMGGVLRTMNISRMR